MKRKLLPLALSAQLLSGQQPSPQPAPATQQSASPASSAAYWDAVYGGLAANDDDRQTLLGGALMKAIVDGRPDEVEYLAGKVHDLNKPRLLELSPAADYQWFRDRMNLVEKGAVEQERRTRLQYPDTPPLEAAIIAGRPEIVEKLLKAGANLKQQMENTGDPYGVGYPFIALDDSVREMLKAADAEYYASEIYKRDHKREEKDAFENAFLGYFHNWTEILYASSSAADRTAEALAALDSEKGLPTNPELRKKIGNFFWGELFAGNEGDKLNSEQISQIGNKALDKGLLPDGDGEEVLRASRTVDADFFKRYTHDLAISGDTAEELAFEVRELRIDQKPKESFVAPDSAEVKRYYAFLEVYKELRIPFVDLMDDESAIFKVLREKQTSLAEALVRHGLPANPEIEIEQDGNKVRMTLQEFFRKQQNQDMVDFIDRLKSLQGKAPDEAPAQPSAKPIARNWEKSIVASAARTGPGDDIPPR